MSMRKGIVVGTHPEDNSVDIVMVDNGMRLTGVQVLSGSASTRSGTIDLPEIPKKKNKWDITEVTDQEVHAVVGYIGRSPVVTGFLFPQINQIASKDPKRRVFRHQSDVSSFIDGNGNFQMDFPNGTYVRVGEAADREETAGKNADGNSAVNRNTGSQKHIRIGLGGGAGTITITPAGKVTFDIKQDFELLTDANVSVKAKGNADVETDGNITAKAGGNLSAESTGPATVTAPQLTVNSPTSTFNGVVLAQAYGIAPGGTGLAEVKSLKADVDVTAAGVSLTQHPHSGVMPGPGNTGTPVPTAS